MAVRATVSRFPIDSDAQENSGLPWGVTVTPFAAKDEEGRSPAYGTDGNLLPRCENCWAYFNNFCELDQWSWTCCLCSQLNGLSSKAIARYSHPQSCAEMTSSFVDLELPVEGEDEGMQPEPVYVAAIDLSSLGPGSLFGLATFSHKLGVYDVQGPIRVVKNVFVPPDTEGTLPIELEDVMPLLHFLAPVIGEARNLSGYSFSAQNNIIHPSTELGSKTTVGPYCMLGEGSQMGDKCSVKLSVIGRHCRIGSNVKVVNSVVMNHVSIADGCSIQGSVICSNVQLQERVVLKDCQVGAGFVVTAGSECKGEALAKKEK